MFYSKSTGGFYDPEVHGTNIPSDAVQITVAQWQALLDAQANGQIIQADANGNPVAVNPPGPTQAQTVSIISNAIQSSLDAGAQKWQYDSIVAASSYANSTNAQYAADAKALIGWRDAVWAWAIPLFASVTAGESPETFMANMPVQPNQPQV